MTNSNANERVNAILETVTDTKNRDTLREYLAERKAGGVKGTTLANDANILRDYARSLGAKPLKDAAKDDILKWVNQTTRERIWRNNDKAGKPTITRRTVSLNATTLSIRKVILKAFYKWLMPQPDPNAFPILVAWLKTTKPNGDFIPTDDLLTAEDLRKLLQAVPDTREKALLAVLYESGMRAGEVCSLNIGSVTFDDYGALITMPKKGTGLKTGARRIRLLPGGSGGSVPYLQAWWENHPDKETRDAPLFYSMSHRSPKARFTPNALYYLVKSAATSAGLKKDVHPHLFRHTAATERAREGWTEYEMRAFFGWSRSSTMPSHYVHLAGQDYEDKLLERKGLKTRGEQQHGALTPRTCRVCRSANLPTAFFCQNCRAPVSPKAEAEIERQRQDFMHEQMAEFVLGKNDNLAEIIAGKVLAKMQRPITAR